MSQIKDSPDNSTRRGVLFRQRMNKKGYEWLCHWVPKEFKEKIKEYAKSLGGK